MSVTITCYARAWVVTAPGMEARTFTSERTAESYAEIRSVVMDLPVVRKVS